MALLLDKYANTKEIIEQTTIIIEAKAILGGWLKDHDTRSVRKDRLSRVFGVVSHLDDMRDLKDDLNREWDRLRKKVQNEKGLTLTDLQDIKKQLEDKNNLKSILESAAPAINAVLNLEDEMNQSGGIGAKPDAGNLKTSGDINVEISLPISPGILVGGKLEFHGERDKTSTLIKTNLSITGGIGADLGSMLAKIQAELGLHVEAKGKDTAEALRLISYAFYRRFEESNVLPRAISNRMWGGETGTFEEADKWAAQIEKQSMTGGNYVEMGLRAALEAKAKAGANTGIEGKVAATSGSKYTQESVEQKKQGGLGSTRKTPGFGVAQEKIGFTFGTMEAQGTAKVMGKGASIHVIKSWDQRPGDTEHSPKTKIHFALEGVDLADIFPSIPKPDFSLPNLPQLPNFPGLPDIMKLPSLNEILARLKKLLPQLPKIELPRLPDILPHLCIRFPNIDILKYFRINFPDIQIPPEILEAIEKAKEMAQETREHLREAADKTKAVADKHLAQAVVASKTAYTKISKEEESTGNNDARKKNKSDQLGNKIDSLSTVAGLGNSLLGLIDISTPFNRTYDLSFDSSYGLGNSLEEQQAEIIASSKETVDLSSIPLLKFYGKRNKEWLKIKAEKAAWKAI